jgi:DNA-directed RNA polymerase alpha subunit
MALKICKKGHQFNKTSDCPICPICEEENRPRDGFLASLSAPARRALENNDIDTVEKLSAYTEKEILKLHGLGNSTIPKLKAALNQTGLEFKSEK